MLGTTNMIGAFRKYLQDLDDGKVKSEEYYLNLEQESIEEAYDKGYKDCHTYKNYNESYFEENCLE